MFSKILIANRGEIACRVIATARKFGIQTVAVYADADAEAKHVAMADEAVAIGPSAAAESYLQPAKIIDACKRTGAEAIHPGYGFLSENPTFVEAVEAEGLVFIGPSAAAIRAMGRKDAAKALMIEAGVPVVPGYHGESQDPEVLAAEADKIGYPVMIKARAGGGGKGMRLVREPAAFRAALDGAQREGQASFGDPVCLVERYIAQPRHIEIQVFGDGHGNVIHLFERDCSLQRRHQKVIEEAPAPDMPASVRAAMGKAATDAARAIGYAGAGTVEFIVDGTGPLREDGFWFMEMNTRLQVEHPVSEAITGLDFVELQLRVASGEPLPMTQQDLSINGWSFEARVYAEDVSKGFLPATGRLDHLSFPAATAFAPGAVRIDSGVRAGDEISPWYDPMIAKVIAHGATREEALNRLVEALSDSQIAGAVTNLDFLVALSRHEGFAAGRVDTGLIDRELISLLEQAPAPPYVFALAAVGGLGLLDDRPSPDPWAQLIGWRHWAESTQHVELGEQGEGLSFAVSIVGARHFRVQGESFDLSLSVTPTSSKTRFELTCEGNSFAVGLIRTGNSIAVFADGRSFGFEVPDPLVQADAAGVATNAIQAPMPGLVQQVFAQAGQAVTQGEPLLVLEAMKMEHRLCAPRDGVVLDVLAAVGDQIADGTVLVALGPIDD